MKKYKLPWSIAEDYKDDIRSCTGELLATCYIMGDPDFGDNQEEKNAQLIVKCVNAFPALVEALEAVMEFGLDDFKSGEQELYAQIEKALSIAKGE